MYKRTRRNGITKVSGGKYYHQGVIEGEKKTSEGTYILVSHPSYKHSGSYRLFFETARGIEKTDLTRKPYRDIKNEILAK